MRLGGNLLLYSFDLLLLLESFLLFGCGHGGEDSGSGRWELGIGGVFAVVGKHEDYRKNREDAYQNSNPVEQLLFIGVTDFVITK